MTSKGDRPADAADLRRRAEEKAHTDKAQAQKPLMGATVCLLIWNGSGLVGN